MKKQTNYALMLPLEQIALRRIAVALYSEPRILASIATSKIQLRPDGAYGIRRPEGAYVEDKMSKLQLPESLTTEMKPILKAVGSQLFAWMSTHKEYFSNSISFQSACFQKLRWTTAGTVDDRKTAEELVRCDLLDIAKRFELACLYCLEDRIPLLWEELPDGDKRTFCASPVKTPHLQLFLPYILEKHPRIDTHDRMACSNPFEESALRGHKTLAVYCFSKLTKEEREASLVRTTTHVMTCRLYYQASDFRRNNLADIALYLLYVMTPEERMGIFRSWPLAVIECFLDWPWKDRILEVADIVWKFLPEHEYCSLMRALWCRMFTSGYYFPRLFQNFFLRSPVLFREQFVDAAIFNKEFLGTFLRNGDTETVQVIFRSVDAADRVKLLSGDSGFRFIKQWSHKRHLLEEVFRAAGLSKEHKERLKAEFIAIAKREKRDYADSSDLLREELGEFFDFLEDTDEKV